MLPLVADWIYGSAYCICHTVYNGRILNAIKTMKPFLGAIFVWICISTCSFLPWSNGLRVCDWPGVGKSSETGSNRIDLKHSAIHVLKLTNCTDGIVTWRFVRNNGALLVEILPPLQVAPRSTGLSPRTGNGENRWKLCVRPTSKQTNVIIRYLANITDNTSPLPLIRDKVDSNLYCTDYTSSSSSGRYHYPITLYVELEKKYAPSSYKSRASFYYSISTSESPSVITDSIDHCAPCTKDEVVKKYCSAELAFKGVLLSKKHNVLRFSVSKFIRNFATKYDANDEDGEIFTAVHNNNGHERNFTIEASVISPPQCALNRTKIQDPHEYLVLAEVRMGRAHALCVPLWPDWLEIKRETENLPPNFNGLQSFEPLCDING